MSKKDFQAIAAAIYQTSNLAHVRWETATTANAFRDGVFQLREELVRVLAASNPRFDRARFLEACETGKCRGMRQVR